MAGTSDKEFLIRVRADIQKALTDFKQLSGDIDKTGRVSDRSSRQVQGLGRSLDILTKATAAYFSIRTLRDMVMQADAYNVLQTRIRTATKATGDYAQVSRELYAISKRNGSELENSVSVYQSLARSANELGASSTDVLALTDAVQQLGVIGGSSQTAMSAGLLQFSQGLAAGVFRAEEFNSILENLPEVANRIAKGMGMTVGELRNAVLNGKVLSKDVFDSLLKQAPEIAREFQDIPQSVARAGTSMSNSFARLLGQIDKASQGTGAIAAIMSKITESMDAWSDYLGENELEALMRQRAHAMEQYQQYIQAGMSKDSAYIQWVLNKIDELDKKIIEANRNLKPQTAGAASAPVSAGKKGNEQKRDEDAVQRLTSALELQAATLDKTSGEVALYKLQLAGATAEEMQAARAALRTIQTHDELSALLDEAIAQQDAMESAYADRAKANQQMVKDLADEIALMQMGNKERFIEQQMRKLSADATDEQRDAVRRMAAELYELSETGEDSMDRLVAATRGWGEQFTNTMADMVQTGKLNFRELADSIISDLLRIQIYQSITQPLFNAMGIPGFSAGTHHSGGVVGQSTAGRMVSPLAFAGAPRYHSGGLVGLKPHERPIIAMDGEEVLTADDPRHVRNLGQGGGDMRVILENKGTPKETVGQSLSFELDGPVLKVMIDDVQRRGRFASFMERTYNLQRRPG